MAPTPMMAPWPGMSRGTDCTVPMVPGLVRVTVAPAQVVGGQLVGPDLVDQLLVGVDEAGEVEGVGLLDDGTMSEREPSDFSWSTAMPRATWGWRTMRGLPSASWAKVLFMAGTASTTARTTA